MTHPNTQADERVTVCANCNGKLYQTADPNNIHWYHEGTGDVRCPTRFAEPRAAVTAPRGDVVDEALGMFKEVYDTVTFLGGETIHIAVGSELANKLIAAAPSSPTPAESVWNEDRCGFCGGKTEHKPDCDHGVTPAERTQVAGAAEEICAYFGDTELAMGGHVNANGVAAIISKHFAATPAPTKPVRPANNDLDLLRQCVEDTIAVARKDEDGDGFITAYHFQTGAIHRLLAEARKGNGQSFD